MDADVLLPYLIVAGVLAAVMGFFTWLAAVVRRRGGAGAGVRAAMASYEEAFRVTAHDSHYEIQAQAEARSPLSSAGDGWRPGREAAGSYAVEGRRRPLGPYPRRRGRGLRRLWGLSGRGRERR
ncbi:hypothetical protein [Streptomyces sp. S.PNR 29]|uniref:hypothetical protein n=1 Tax=Streptomyces sp. S.PNR 29 TaxID=2973805 RepID=UPI0025B19C30|nr:hypothetical protein [Streptomyces sp. S.PNR 29]MDN0197080.1 hypothetical protein [Streptomyces sp. S.PNR 29]